MSKLEIKKTIYFLASFALFGGTAIKWMMLWETNPYAAFFYGLIFAPIWGLLLFLWLSVLGIGYMTDSKQQDIEDSIEEDYSLREEQIRKTMEERDVFGKK